MWNFFADSEKCLTFAALFVAGILKRCAKGIKEALSKGLF